MHRKIAVLSLPLLLCIVYFAGSETITKVLQNGEDDYQGCEDSYTDNRSPETNYGDDPYLIHKNCQT